MIPGVLRERVGDVEVVHANPQLLRIVEKIVDQNAAIVKQNAELLKSFASPALMNLQSPQELDEIADDQPGG